MNDQPDRAVTINEALARIEALEAALRPFAEYGAQLPERYQHEFETVLLEATPGPNITVGDVRRAAALLTEARPEGGRGKEPLQ
jgi:hypothetical protein